MGTRGAYGFHRDGVDKITYNHFGSYPEHLGLSVVQFCKNTSVEEMNEIFDRIVLVQENDQPKPEELKEIDQIRDLLGTEERPLFSRYNWYHILRGAQGNLDVYKHGLRYMTDNKDFLKDGLFCEWGYVINLHTQRLEVYRGLQHTHQQNRYALTEEERLKREAQARRHNWTEAYYNCHLILEFPLRSIPDDAIHLMNTLAQVREEALDQT